MVEWRFKIHKGPQFVVFDFPATYKATGLRYTGKGAWGEALATQILHQGGTVLDLMGARASRENLAWLDSPYASLVAFVTSDSCVLISGVPTFKISDFLKDCFQIIKDHKIIVMLRDFFESDEWYYDALLKITQTLRERDEWVEGAPDLLLIREAQNYLKALNSRSNIKNQKAAEEEFIQFHDEAVHSGFSVFVDSKRVKQITKDIRDTAEYSIYKNMGAEDLPDQIQHLFHEYSSEMFRSLHPWEFILHTRWNAVGFGVFEYPWWHVKRGKSLRKKFNIWPTFVKRDGSTSVPSFHDVGRPEGKGRKITKEIHNYILEGKHNAITGEGIVAQIMSIFKVRISVNAVNLEYHKHKMGICGYCEKKE